MSTFKDLFQVFHTPYSFSTAVSFVVNNWSIDTESVFYVFTINYEIRPALVNSAAHEALLIVAVFYSQGEWLGVSDHWRAGLLLFWREPWLYMLAEVYLIFAAALSVKKKLKSLICITVYAVRISYSNT